MIHPEASDTHRVLIVEPQETHRDKLKELLQHYDENQFLILEASTVAEGLEKNNSQRLDCVFLSGSLPLDESARFLENLETGIVVLIIRSSQENLAASALERGFENILISGPSLTAQKIVRFVYKGIDSIILNSQIKVLSEALKSRDEFLSIAAHELRTPLTATKLKFQMGVRLLERNKTQGLDYEHLIQLFKDGDRQVSKLSRLVDNLLDLSRLEINEFNLQLEKMDLIELIHEVYDRFSDQLKYSHCEVIFDLPKELVGVWDRDRLDQVITNLLTNIIRYAAGRPFTLQAQQTPHKTILKVSDQGVGILPENKEKIFDRYERAANSKKNNGIGLGLFITKAIVVAHFGTIHVEPTLPHGSTFVIELPNSSGA